MGTDEVEEVATATVFVTSVPVSARQTAENLTMRKKMNDNTEGLRAIVFDAGVVLNS
jgi:hypothetical protein